MLAHGNPFYSHIETCTFVVKVEREGWLTIHSFSPLPLLDCQLQLVQVRVLKTYFFLQCHSSFSFVQLFPFFCCVCVLQLAQLENWYYSPLRFSNDGTTNTLGLHALVHKHTHRHFLVFSTLVD